MSGAFDVLQMQEEDIFWLLVVRNHLGGTNFDFQMQQYILKRKMMACMSQIEKGLGESFMGGSCHFCHWKPCRCKHCSFYKPWLEAALMFAAVTGAAPMAVASHLELSLTTCSQPSSGWLFWRLLIIWMTISLSEAPYMNLPASAMCNRLSSLIIEHSWSINWSCKCEFIFGVSNLFYWLKCFNSNIMLCCFLRIYHIIFIMIILICTAMNNIQVFTSPCIITTYCFACWLAFEVIW